MIGERTTLRSVGTIALSAATSLFFVGHYLGAVGCTAVGVVCFVLKDWLEER